MHELYATVVLKGDDTPTVANRTILSLGEKKKEKKQEKTRLSVLIHPKGFGGQ